MKFLLHILLALPTVLPAQTIDTVNNIRAIQFASFEVKTNKGFSFNEQNIARMGTPILYISHAKWCKPSSALLRNIEDFGLRERWEKLGVHILVYNLARFEEEDWTCSSKKEEGYILNKIYDTYYAGYGTHSSIEYQLFGNASFPRVFFFDGQGNTIFCNENGGYNPESKMLWLLDKTIADYFNVKPMKSITICHKCNGEGYILVCYKCKGTGRCKVNIHGSPDESVGICPICGGHGDGPVKKECSKIEIKEWKKNE